MPNNREHNKICENQGYDKKLCEQINKWMDEPAAEFPGCQHRNFRHGKNDCDSIYEDVFKKTNDVNKAEQAKEICLLHRIIDKKLDKGCGCKPLFED